MIALDIGGVLSIRCPTCGEERGNECRTAPTSPGGFRVTRPHAARLAAAPPIVEAHVGDLVLVRYRGEHVAQLVDIGVVLAVRFWRPSAQVFASPRLLEREAVIGLAPDEARTALAREELRLEGERNAAARAMISPGMVGALSLNGEKIADVETAEIDGHRFTVAPDIAEGRGPFDPGRITSDPSPTTPDGCLCAEIDPSDRPCIVCDAALVNGATAAIAAASKMTPTTPDAPPDPWFTSDSAETTARKDW